MTARGFDVAIIGAGSAAASLVGHLDGSGLEIVVFEQGRVGGECPFTACMPSKSMLHDVGTGRPWDEAVRRRDEIVSHLDDSDHTTASASRASRSSGAGQCSPATAWSAPAVPSTPRPTS